MFGSSKQMIRASVVAKVAAAALSLIGLAGCDDIPGLPQEINDLGKAIDASGIGSGSTSGAGSAPGAAAVAPTPITASITASKSSNIRPGENITFNAVGVQGGTPPYTYFWIMDHDAAFTPAGPAFTRQIDDSAPTRTVTLVVRDSTNTDSEYFSLAVTLEAPTIPAVNTVCGTMAGVWNTTYGVMTLTQSGNTVSGTYDYFGCIGTITGTLTGGPAVSTACPDCLRWTGTWGETATSCSGQTGSFDFSVDPDLASFTGRWSKNPNTHWQADFWSGTHRKCGDGSDAGPRP